MTFRDLLSNRIDITGVKNILRQIPQDINAQEELARLIYDEDEYIVYQTLWVLSQLSSSNNCWLISKQKDLRNLAMTTSHCGICRLSLSVLNKLPKINPIDIEFYDFCIHKITAVKEPVGIRSLCIKSVYRYAIDFPELKQELISILRSMESESSPAVVSARDNTLKRLTV